MKLNYDLVRIILLKIEDVADGDNNFMFEYFYEEISDYNNIIIRYHLNHLHEANLVTIVNDYIIDLTPSGRNYLDTIRNDNIWAKVQAQLQPLSSVTLSVISEVASSFTLKSLGL